MAAVVQRVEAALADGSRNLTSAIRRHEEAALQEAVQSAPARVVYDACMALLLSAASLVPDAVTAPEVARSLAGHLNAFMVALTCKEYVILVCGCCFARN